MNFTGKIVFVILLGVLSSCSLTKYVPQGRYLVKKVEVSVDDKNVKPSEVKPYIKQNVNHKTFGFIPMQLGLYSLSGTDSTKWHNRFLKKSGTAPVIYDETLTVRSENEIRKMLSNKGFLNADVEAEVVYKKKNAYVKYNVTCADPLIVEELRFNNTSDTLGQILENEFSSTILKEGMLLDRAQLDKERIRLTNRARNLGFYEFNKEYINYTADTMSMSKLVGLTLNVLPRKGRDSDDIAHKRYRIGRVMMITDYDPLNPQSELFMKKDTVVYDNYHIVYGPDRFITPSTLARNCFIIPGDIYSDRMVDMTYTSFSRLQNLKYVNVKFEPSPVDEGLLDCYILLTKGKNQTLRAELEGTNSAGNFGFATSVTYQHRNIFHGAEVLTVKVHGGYEYLTGKLKDLIKNNYMEYGAEVGLTFPQFMFPFLSRDFKKTIRANTEIKLSYDFQQRPEYQRVIAGAGFRYNWATRHNRFRHSLDFIDVNYVYLPYKSDAFIESIINQNPISYSSYNDHLISRTGYSFFRSNQSLNSLNRDIYSFRIATEFAGNVLYGASALLKKKKDDDPYTIAGLRFEQYWKLDFDYVYTKKLNSKNALAFHIASGIGVPYLNSAVMPFEKRYYSGGANSVRGWSVRTLGPGRFNSTIGSLDYFNQCGDIRLDSSIEYRSKLFWKLEMAAFIDAGNVWTIKDYENQSGGAFDMESFYKEIALAYGLGIRFDFNFFVLRFDLGMKAYDPSLLDYDPWVLKRPFEDKGRNMTFHFAVGYPF